MENKLYLSQTKRQQNSVLVTEEEINEKLLASNTLVNMEHVHLILSRVLKHNFVNKPNILVINQNNMENNKPCWIRNIILGYFAIQNMFINKALNMFFVKTICYGDI